MKIFTIIVSKKILGISTKHEAEKSGKATNEKIKQLGEVRQEDPFQWKVRNNNFDHYNFLVSFRNISNFHAFSFRNTRSCCKLCFDHRCDPSGWFQVHTNLIHDKKRLMSEFPLREIFFVSISLSLFQSLSLLPSLYFALYLVMLSQLNMSSLSFSVSLFLLSISLFFHLSFYLNVFSFVLSHTLSLPLTGEMPRCVCVGEGEWGRGEMCVMCVCLAVC